MVAFVGGNPHLLIERESGLIFLNQTLGKQIMGGSSRDYLWFVINVVTLTELGDVHEKPGKSYLFFLTA